MPLPADKGGEAADLDSLEMDKNRGLAEPAAGEEVALREHDAVEHERHLPGEDVAAEARRREPAHGPADVAVHVQRGAAGEAPLGTDLVPNEPGVPAGAAAIGSAMPAAIVPPIVFLNRVIWARSRCARAHARRRRHFDAQESFRKAP